jgi:NhaC family Na+:H+ antiporter
MQYKCTAAAKKNLGGKEMNNPKKPSMTMAKTGIVLIFLIVSLTYTIRVVDGYIHVPLLLSAAFAGLIAVMSGYEWQDLEAGIVRTISMAMPAILVMLCIGMIVGVWITAGVVPSLIYYGLQILSPGIFLVATCLICAIISLATGSSWTTAATVGIALIGVGQGLGMPLPMVAGAIISGAYFGDKMSPLSDTTNLAPAMAGANLFDHIRHMVYTTGPSLLIALVLYGLIGMRYAGKELDVAGINEMLNALQGSFNISPWMLLPPVIVIMIVVMKVPAVPGLFGGVLVGALFGIVFQGNTIGDLFMNAYTGYSANTGVEFVDSLLSRGGIEGMYYTIGLILCAMCFGGIMDTSDMLKTLAIGIMKFAKSTGSLVVATILTAIATNAVAGDQYLAIVLPGRMFKELYDERGLAPKNLSRILEDSGTLTSPLIPWNTCGAYMYASLGVHPFAYAPYAFLNIINPLVSIFYGYTGLTMEKMTEEEYATYQASKETV